MKEGMATSHCDDQRDIRRTRTSRGPAHRPRRRDSCGPGSEVTICTAAGRRNKPTRSQRVQAPAVRNRCTRSGGAVVQ